MTQITNKVIVNAELIISEFESYSNYNYKHKNLHSRYSLVRIVQILNTPLKAF